MKYDIKQQGLEVKRADVDIIEIVIRPIPEQVEDKPAKKDKDGNIIKEAVMKTVHIPQMRYRTKITKGGEFIPYPNNLTLHFCELNNDAWKKLKALAMTDFKKKPEVKGK